MHLPLRTQIRTLDSVFLHSQHLRVLTTNHTFKMSQPSLPSYKAICESAAEAQHLADNAARVAASLQVGALNSALMREQMMTALDHQRGYLGHRSFLEHHADLLATIATLRGRNAELEQRLRPTGQAQPVMQAPANASSNGCGSNGDSAYGGVLKKRRNRCQGRSKKYQGKPPGPRKDDGAGGAGASGVSA